MNHEWDPTNGTWRGVLITEPGGVAFLKVLVTGSYSISKIFWERIEGEPTILVLNEPPLPGFLYTPDNPKLQQKMWGTYGYFEAGGTTYADGGSYDALTDDGEYLDGNYYVVVQAQKGRKVGAGLQVSFQSS